MTQKPKNNTPEKFKIVKFYNDGRYGNDIDILLKDGTKVQIAVDKDIELTTDLIGKEFVLPYKVVDGVYYFDRITKKIV